MTPTHDIAGEALLRAFAERGYPAALNGPDSISVSLPGGSSMSADITAWRRSALSHASPSALQELAAQYADQAVTAFGRHAGHSPGNRLVEAGNLRLRVYPDEALGGMRDSLMARPLAPGLSETVVVDYPDSIMPLNRADVAGTSEAEVFGAALTLSIGSEPHHVSSQEIEGVPVTVIGGEHRYVSAHVHVLRRHVPPSSLPYGALVSLPLPEYVIVHAIGAVHLFAALEAVQGITRRLHEGGERAISPQVYWWRPGAHERLPEEEALRDGLVPDLRPVGIEVDHRDRSVTFQSRDTDELAELWLRDRG